MGQQVKMLASASSAFVPGRTSYQDDEGKYDWGPLEEIAESFKSRAKL